MSSIIASFSLLICLISTLLPPTSASSVYSNLLKRFRSPKIPEGNDNRPANFLRPRQLIDYSHEEEDNTIFGGEGVDEGIYPWFVELIARNGGTTNERRCAGALLSGDTIVTLANCLYTEDGILADPAESEAIIKRQETARGAGEVRSWKLFVENEFHSFPSIDDNIAIIVISGEPIFPVSKKMELEECTYAPLFNSSF